MGSPVDAVNGGSDTELAPALDAGDDLRVGSPENTDVVKLNSPYERIPEQRACTCQAGRRDVVVGTTGWTRRET